MDDDNEIFGYRRVRLLGKGGMGDVHEVLSTDGRHLAVKIFNARRETSDFLRARFLAEGKLLAKLSHPRLVHVYDVGIDRVRNRPVFVMDLVLDAQGRSTTLDDARKAGLVTEELAERWYGDLVEALAYCHRQGIVHRDIKLNNILLDADGHAVLSDFGISRIFNPQMRNELQVMTTFIEGETTGTRPVMGTYWYLAPELRQGRPATVESDWYALGVTFFRLLTGLWYEPGTNAMELLTPYDERWRKRLETLLSNDPARRTPQARSGSVTSQRRRPLRPCLIAAGILLTVLTCIGLFRAARRNPLPVNVPDDSAILSFDLDSTNRLTFCPCPAGTNAYNKVAIAVTAPYWLGEAPVTRRQWFALRGEPLTAWSGGEDAPMTYVSRDETLDFCDRLNRRFADRLPKGYVIRLPTLAEWRLAYTTGHTITNAPNRSSQRKVYDLVGWYGQGISGDPLTAGMRNHYHERGLPIPRTKDIWPDFPPRAVTNAGDVGWIRLSSKFAPVPVKQKPANGLGLYDLCGNCFERAFDCGSARRFFYFRSEWGVNTCDIYKGQGHAVTNPVERSGSFPLMTGTYFAPDQKGDAIWSSEFDRMPHLGFRLCIGPVTND